MLPVSVKFDQGTVTLAADAPVISVDTKKKELVGNFSRDGHLDTQEVLATFDHDFPSFASGVIIPHGLYDVKHNDGHVNLGTSHDTGEFACDILFTPEMSGLLDRDSQRASSNLRGEEEDGVLAACRAAAKEHGIWVHLGSLAVRVDCA